MVITEILGNSLQFWKPAKIADQKIGSNKLRIII